MQYQIEFTRHVEGLPDQSAFGLAQTSHAQLVNATSPLILLKEFPFDGIFHSYSQRRSLLLTSMRHRGWWDETLFPILKDIARFGADKLLNSDTVSEATQVAVDAATMALSNMIPGLAPAIQKAGSAVSTQASDSAAEYAQQLQSWIDERLQGLHDIDEITTHSNSHNDSIRWHDNLDTTFIDTAADHVTRRSALTRYGIESNPGPPTLTLPTDTDDDDIQP